MTTSFKLEALVKEAKRCHQGAKDKKAELKPLDEQYHALAKIDYELTNVESTLAQRRAARDAAAAMSMRRNTVRDELEVFTQGWREANNEAVAEWQRSVGLPDLGARNLQSGQPTDKVFPELRDN